MAAQTHQTQGILPHLPARSRTWIYRLGRRVGDPERGDPEQITKTGEMVVVVEHAQTGGLSCRCHSQVSERNAMGTVRAILPAMRTDSI